jgi:polyribonucleotide nucleotidyltransferase
MTKTFEVAVGGSSITFETGKLAKQASGSILAKQGETVVLVSACISETPRSGIDFFPLLVDYEERYYSAGKIPGGFIKREGRPSETAILSCRVIDRSIRSLFDDNLRYDVHVVSTVLSVDQVNPPNVLAVNAASAALTISEIPWEGPVGAVRIGRIDGQFVVNPMEQDMSRSDLDLLVAGHAGGITMVEAGAKELPEEIMVDALELAHREILKIVDAQLRMREEIGKPKLVVPDPVRIPEIDRFVEETLREDIRNAVRIHEKKPRGEAIAAARQKALDAFDETFPDSAWYIKCAVEEQVKKAMRTLVIEERFRSDGRGMRDVRPISVEVGVLPRCHGSALFTRGETQSLAVTTLGMMGEDEQILDGLKIDEPSKRFMLHYNFPPYSVGEVRPMRGPGRREVGHGALAERALKQLMPEEEKFPYIVRVVSDILESNGSSSMASVCGGSLSLMDAGVPFVKACAGVAMGLIKEGDKVEILTDIQGLEDHYGDMDFKVAGTRDGITALQMDNKAGGITREVLEAALGQAKEGRLHILGKMDEVLSTPRDSLSAFAPRITTIQVDPEKIRDIIGPGGKTIRSIVAQTGAKIDIQDDGKVFIASVSEEGTRHALSLINDLIREVQPGEVFAGKVVRMMAFGAFVELLPGKDGLLHVSEVSTHHVPKVDDILKPGDPVLVIVKEIDDMGRVNLSRRRLLERAEEFDLQNRFADLLAMERDREEKIAAVATTRPPRSGEDRPERSGGRSDGNRSFGDRDRRGSQNRGGGRPPRRREE